MKRRTTILSCLIAFFVGLFLAFLVAGCSTPGTPGLPRDFRDPVTEEVNPEIMVNE